MKNLILSILSFIFISVELNSQTDYEKGVDYYDNGEFQKAVPLFISHLKTIDDNDIEAIIDIEEYIVDSYNELDSVSLASKWAYKLLQKDSLNRFALIILLRSSFENNDFSMVRKYASHLIDDLNEENINYSYLRGVSNIHFKENEIALHDLLKVHEVNPNFQNIKYYIGFTLLELGHYDKSISFFNDAILMKNNIDESLHGLALAYYNIKDYQNAQHFLNKTLEINPDFFQTDKLKRDYIYMQGEIHYNLGQYRKAIPYLEQINDKAFKDYSRVTIITVSSYENLEEEYTKRGELDKAAYFAAKRAERVFNEMYIEDGLETIDRAISLDSSLHYLLFKSQVMIAKIIYYIQQEAFDSKEQAMDFSREALALIYKVYADIFAIDPENEFYLNRYIEDLYFFNNLFNEPEIIGEICETYDKLESYDYDFDKKIRSSLCFNTGEKTKNDYDVVLFELESFEERFGVSLIEDE